MIERVMVVTACALLGGLLVLSYVGFSWLCSFDC